MRRLLLIAVCFPLALTQASANSSSTPLRGKVVFSSDRGPNVRTAEIYSIRTDGTRRRNLTRNQGHDGGFAWAPAGNLIAFWAERTEADQLIRGLYVMRPDGSGQRRLTPSDMQVAQQSEAPTWSPDGRRLAFSAYRAGVYGIWVVRVDGHDLQLLATPGIFPVWAPRGNRIAFDGEEGIEVVDADGGGHLRLADTNVFSSPTWSPDARVLAFVRDDRATRISGVYRVAAAGGPPQPVVFGQEGFLLSDPAWSPDGTRIAFTEGQGRHWGSIGVIKTVDADGGVATALGSGANPVWSPNGRRIASARSAEINVMNTDGSGRRRVRDEKPARLTAGPAWSQDGKTLLFASVRDSADHELFVVDAGGSHRHRLTSNNVEDVLPAWSPDHTRIAFARGTGRTKLSIWTMSANGSNQHRLRRGTHPSWSPEGSRLAFEHKGVVYTMTDRGRRIRRIVRGDHPSWAPRGSSIAFFRDDALLVADVRRGTVWDPRADLTCEDRGEGTATILSSPEWSPDAKSIVVSVTCDYGISTEISAVIVGLGGSFSEVPIDLAPESRLAWSPDGRRLAFSLGTEAYGDAPKIVTTRLDGSSRTTVSSGAGDDRDPDW